MLVISGGTMAAPRSVAAQADSPTLDEAWFASLARAESLMSAASCRGEMDSTDRAAVVVQIRNGVQVLGAVLLAGIAADTVLAGPLATVRPETPARRHGILKVTGVISAVVGLAHVIATLGGASPQARSALAYVGGSAAAARGVFNALRPRSPSRPATDTIRGVHTLDLESDLRLAVDETERSAELLWVELRALALDSCATDEHVVWLARRYVNALEETSALVDSRVAGSLAKARSCAECPGFTAESRERCGTLASHLDALSALWRERRWLFERAKKNTLDYLVLADRPR